MEIQLTDTQVDEVVIGDLLRVFEAHLIEEDEDGNQVDNSVILESCVNLLEHYLTPSDFAVFKETFTVE